MVTKSTRLLFFIFIFCCINSNLLAQYQSAGWYYRKGKMAYEAGRYDESLGRFKHASRKGHAEAEYYIAKLYNGKLEVNDKKYLKWLEKSAENGYADAQLKLGYAHGKGNHGLVIDEKEAFKWYMLSAEQGNEVALYNVGVYYYYGYGVDIDYDEAFNWYSESAKLGYTKAEFQVGYMYHTGKGVEQDYFAAKTWYEKAAEKNHKVALYNLGVLYENGYGIEQNYELALHYYQKSSEAGYSKAGESYDKLKAKYDDVLNRDSEAIENGTFTGNTTYTYANGDIYKGDFKNGERHGIGSITYANGDTYEGGWVNDKKNGQGTYNWKEPWDRYTGNWVDDKRTGYGEYYWSVEEFYKGEWLDDKKHGEGYYKSSKSYEYFGTWVNNKRHGDFEIKRRGWGSRYDATAIYENGDEISRNVIYDSQAISYDDYNYSDDDYSDSECYKITDNNYDTDEYCDYEYTIMEGECPNSGYKIYIYYWPGESIDCDALLSTHTNTYFTYYGGKNLHTDDLEEALEYLCDCD